MFKTKNMFIKIDESLGHNNDKLTNIYIYICSINCMVQHGFKQTQNSFRSMIQICIADTLLIFESFDVFDIYSERFGTVPKFYGRAI